MNIVPKIIAVGGGTMRHPLYRYIGRVVRMTYIDRKGRITDRRVQVWSVEDGVVKAFCLQRRAPRRFKLDCVLAVEPVAGKWAG